MSKKKKSINKRSLSPTSSPEMNVNLELDIKALRGKNKQLTQAVAKLQQEKAFHLSQMTTLQKDFFTLNSKYVNLKSIFSTIDATMKGCFSKHIELVNSLGTVVRLCALGATASNLNKDPKTQTVKPQFVNGHVLQNPTITLSRFNDSDSHTPQRISPQISPNISGGGDFSSSPVRRSNNLNLSQSVVRPSTSRMPVSPIDIRLSTQETNENNDNLDEFVQSFESEVRRRHINLERLQLQNVVEDEDNGLHTPDDSEDEINDPDNRSRLVTIQEEEEEAYNSTLRSLNTSQTNISDRVREIRIFLDPLPKDYINQWENMEHYVTRTSSVTGEPSTSELDPNNTLLNETLASPESTMKFMSSTGESQNLSSKSSPTKRKSTYFGEPSCSQLEESEVEKVQVERGSHKNLNSTPQKFEYDSTTTMSEDSSIILPVRLRGINTFSTSISGIQDSSKVNLDNSKMDTMQTLGLEPKNSRLTTSTPVPNCRSSSRNKKSNVSLNSTKASPADSKVTKRRGGSDDKNMAHIVVKRLSLEKRLSGSPIKKIGDLLNATPIIRSSDIRRGRPRKKTQENTQNTDNNDSSSSSDEENIPKSSQTKKLLNKRNVKGKTKGKENRVSQTPIEPIRSSPRPRRAAKPTILKEPSLSKKMRRSR
ncbi:uncharacterized protein isoform X1 [Leptinotarsa decemlineata]|uniref:uncharacterized protein isoform X1 n=1 Tax=Leptinotarsa decemlineata TaxID=7539 RepID=UPI003D3052DF